MQYLLMQDKLSDDMDCGQENIKTNQSFVPKTELDYLLLGCLLESQQMSQSQSSPNTVRAYSMYQKQFENHKKKNQQMNFRSSNGSTTFSVPFPQNNMTSGQSQYNNFNHINNNNNNMMNSNHINNNNNNINNVNKMPFQNYNGPINPNPQMHNNNGMPSKLNLPRFNNNNNNNQQQNVPPNICNSNNSSDDEMDLSSEKIKKEKKKPKRPNKVKPLGCEWCKVTSSPVWRGGPSGKGSLCNACGLQYMKGFTMERAKETLRKSRGEWKINSQM